MCQNSRVPLESQTWLCLASYIFLPTYVALSRPKNSIFDAFSAFGYIRSSNLLGKPYRINLLWKLPPRLVTNLQKRPTLDHIKTVLMQKILAFLYTRPFLVVFCSSSNIQKAL